MAKHHQRVVSAGPAGRQDVVEVLRWITDGEFSPSLNDAGRLGEVHKVLERVGESSKAISIPFD